MSDSTIQAMEINARSVRTPAPNQNNGATVGIGGRTPNEDDVPRCLSDSFSQYQVPQETAAETAATLPATATDRRPDRMTITREFARDIETDRSEASTQSSEDHYPQFVALHGASNVERSVQYSASAWQRPMAVEVPRRGYGSGTTQYVEKKYHH